jgi:hypothetical protein
VVLLFEVLFNKNKGGNIMLNKYQKVLKKAMDEADELSSSSGRMRPAIIKRDELSRNITEYLSSSPKWRKWARGWVTTDGNWVITQNGSSLLIGRNY